jgi:hypothetical protein
MKAHLISFGVSVLAVVVGLAVAPKILAAVSPKA